MNDTIERPLADAELAEYIRYYEQALLMLDRGEDDDPAEIVSAVDNWVDTWQAERRDAPADEQGPWDDNADFAIAMGIAWGNQLVRRFQWSWIADISDNEATDYAVVSADRALAIYPTSFIKECLDYPDADCTAMLAFNMQIANCLIRAAPASYTNVMSSVRRIIPKR